MTLSTECLNGNCTGCPQANCDQQICECPCHRAMDREVINLARWMLSADEREKNHDPDVARDVKSLAKWIDDAVNEWFAVDTMRSFVSTPASRLDKELTLDGVRLGVSEPLTGEKDGI